MAKLRDQVSEALRRNQGPSIQFDGVWTDWAAIRRVADQIDRLTAAMPDGTVAFVPRNRPVALAALLALLRQGRTIRMSYPFQSPGGIIRDVLRTRPAFALLDIADVTPAVATALSTACVGLLALTEITADPIPVIHGDTTVKGVADGEPGIEILTSGTTGAPKPFSIPHAMVADHIVGHNTLATLQPDTINALPPALLFFPLANISGIYSTLPPLIFGQRVVLLERFSVTAWRDYVVRHRPTQAGMPAACVRMVLDADIPREDLASLRSLGTGAAPLDPDSHRRFEQRYGIPILLSYGATEFGGPVTAMTLDRHREWGERKFGSVGQAIGGARLRVVHAETKTVLPPGEEGLLEVISPRIGPDWIRTSDLAVLDADEFVFLCGRADGAIMRGGFKLLPESIEQALLLHPAVSAVAVAGIPEPRLGEVPGALVVLRSGQTASDVAALTSHLRQHLPATHIPAVWRFCASLPRTVSHKTDRAAVRRLLLQQEQ
jgi:long-chain acyl-CoA synthetase